MVKDVKGGLGGMEWGSGMEQMVEFNQNGGGLLAVTKHCIQCIQSP